MSENVPCDASDQAARAQPQTRRGLVMTWLVAVSAMLILFLFLQGLDVRLPLLGSEVESPSLNDVVIHLHPEQHRTRSPQTRHYAWNITSATIARDGVYKVVILVDGMFPGPTIEARSGDTLVVDIFNGLTEGVSVHWHGLHMRGANDMDGPVGINQCPILPGHTFTYQIPIGEQAGTFWYHAHSELQRADGFYGALVIHNADEDEAALYGYDDEVLLLAGDWYHHAASAVLAEFHDQSNEGHEPFPDSLLLNGHGSFDCTQLSPAARAGANCTAVLQPSLHLDKSLRHRMRVINVGILTGITVSVADAEIVAVQVDGGRRLAVQEDSVTAVGVVYPAQRLDVVLQWPSGDTTSELTIVMDREYLIQHNPALRTTQVFPVYDVRDDAQANSAVRKQRHVATTPASTPRTLNLRNARGSPLPAPLPPPDQYYMVYSVIEILAHKNFVPEGRLNHTAWVPQNPPLLTLPRTQWDGHQLVPWTGRAPAWVELTINNIDTQGHPFHLHGFDFYVVASYEGKGGWDYYNPFNARPPRGGPFNVVDPVSRDTIYVPPYGYVVLRFLADNEGLWVLHCHILWHQASGMSMAFHVLGHEDGLATTQAARQAQEANVSYFAPASSGAGPATHLSRHPMFYAAFQLPPTLHQKHASDSAMHWALAYDYIGIMLVLWGQPL